MGAAWRAKLQFNDSSHPERAPGVVIVNEAVSSHGSSLFPYNGFMASTCASINNNSVHKWL